MKVSELIKKLSEMNPESEVKITDDMYVLHSPTYCIEFGGNTEDDTYVEIGFPALGNLENF
jgi:hypothetical protein